MQLSYQIWLDEATRELLAKVAPHGEKDQKRVLRKILREGLEKRAKTMGIEHAELDADSVTVS